MVLPKERMGNPKGARVGKKRSMRGVGAGERQELRERFLSAWRSWRISPIETAERLGIDPALAIAWAREHRQGQGSLSRFLKRVLYLAVEAQKLSQDPERHLPPQAIQALTRFGNLVPLLEEAWVEALVLEEEA